MPFSDGCFFDTVFKKVNETERAVLLLEIFSFMAPPILIFFAIYAWLRGDNVHCIVLSTMVFLLVTNFLVYRIFHRYSVFRDTLIAMNTVFLIYLLAQGGTQFSGPFWAFLYPPLVFFVCGIRWGTILSLSIFCIAIVFIFMLHAPFREAPYPYFFRVAFLSVLMVATILALVAEFSRHHINTELKKMTELLRVAARTDELTGLSNRRLMKERMIEEIHRYERTKRPFSIIMADIDHFKKINDRLGHKCGDVILMQIADCLNRGLRRVDTVSRWGGEEFLILLPEADLDQALCIAERVRSKIENESMLYEGEPVPVTISLGVSAWKDGFTMEQLIQESDSGLYNAKQGGRNRVCTIHDRV